MATPGTTAAPYLARTTNIANADIDTWLPGDNRTVATLTDYLDITKTFNPLMYGAVGDGATDDTAAVQATLTQAALSNGNVVIPFGSTFLVDALTVPSGIRIWGLGTLKYKAESSSFRLLDLTSVSNVVIEEITLDGNVANQSTWSQFRHSIAMTSCTDCDVRACRFQNTIGDGVYLSDATRVTVTDNRFIGTNVNRNGVTVISGTDVTITKNHFVGMARPDMPGAIDVEPDADTDTIGRVLIAQNIILGDGGGTITLQQGIAIQNANDAAVTGILILGNLIRGDLRYGIAIFGGATHGAFVDVASNRVETITISHAIISSNNTGVIAGNHIRDVSAGSGIHWLGGTLTISGNFIASAYSYGINEAGAMEDAGAILDNQIVDCGHLAGISTGGISTTGNRIDVRGNRVSSPAGVTNIGLYMPSGTQCVVDGNTLFDCQSHPITAATAPHVWGQNTYDTTALSVSGTYPPAAGAWRLGQIIYNLAPTAGGTIGWVCTAAGTPGTWKAFGTIAA